MEKIEKNAIKNHPCFSVDAHNKFSRIHLPVAPRCCIQCKYCIRKYDCANESRPGITSRILSPTEAIERVRIIIERNDRISVIGIAGPGDPLVNDATFEVLNSIKKEFPEIIPCLSTNGLYLSDRLEDIIKSGVKSLTITINAISTGTAENIYSWITYRGKRYTGRSAAECLLFNQWRGLRNAIDAGIIVKINTVLIPPVNASEIPLIAKRAGENGADIMNIIPLIPQAGFKDFIMPSRDQIKLMRDECSLYIPQMTHCRQCRADAFGVIGEDRDMELEVLNAQIGEEYCEMVN